MRTRVAAVQLGFQYFSTPQEFADYVRAPIEQAAANGAQLILLPHLTSLMLLGMFDQDAQPQDSVAELAARQDVSAREWLEQRASYVSEFYLHLFQSLASRVEVWLAPGTVLETDGRDMYLSAFLFNPAGESVGRQRQLQVSEEASAWGVSRDESLRTFATDVGDLGFIIGADARSPGTVRTLEANGAHILLNPAADAVGTPETHALGQAFLVRANLVGGNYRGRSAIYAPIQAAQGHGQVRAQASTDSSPELLLADIEPST